MIRLFVGIALPPELRLRLSLLCAGLPGARWVDPGNLHLTLRFIGEVDEGVASDIDAALRASARRASTWCWPASANSASACYGRR